MCVWKQQNGNKTEKEKTKRKKKKRLMWEGWIRLDWIEFEGSLCIMHSLFKTYDTKWQIMSLIITIIDGCKRSEKKWFCAVAQCCCMKLIELMVWWLQILCVCYKAMLVLTTGSQLSSNFFLTFILFPFSICHYYFFNLML